MEKGSDISKSLALVLIILTIFISAVSTWMLINKSVGSGSEEGGLNRALVQLHILKGPVYEPLQTDTNSGDVKLYIARTKGG
ncbi:hypothetical protein JW898_01420 [Candidatus Woesearchaeota archaeon]|nr:hypothetical protein [Candidatus Woesearchaeota archaeon]